VNVLGLITARGGSKGIPRKNLAPCGGQPLLYWTCRAGVESKVLSRLVISSDDDELIEYAGRNGVETPFVRPAEFATDTASSLSVARHAMSWLQDNEGWRTDVLVLLQPTSPLRTAQHIDEAFALLGPSVDSVVSVVKVPHRFSPWAVLVPEDGRVRDYWQGELPFDKHRRQDQPTLFARNGPAVIVTRAEVLETRSSFYGAHNVPYLMAVNESVDIDDRDDLDWADWLLRRKMIGGRL
jgi:CMP-N,N'-diacetyllegionaminic acid synthase